MLMLTVHSARVARGCGETSAEYSGGYEDLSHARAPCQRSQRGWDNLGMDRHHAAGYRRWGARAPRYRRRPGPL